MLTPCSVADGGKGQPMIITAWKDLLFRRRRVAIAVLGTSLVFALGLVMSASGVLIGGTPVDAASAPTAQALGVERVDPVVFRNTSVGRGEHDQIAYFGVVRGGLGDPAVVAGRRLGADGEIVVDRRFRREVGAKVTLGGSEFTVVGLSEGRSLLAGVPVAYVSLRDAQALAFGGRALATSFLVQGIGRSVPGWVITDDRAVEEEMLQPLRNATKTIDLVRILLWSVAALIVGSVMYLQALERTRDFAVLRATGASSSTIAGSIALQAACLALIASAIAAGLAWLLAPRFSMNVEISSQMYLSLPIVAVVIGLLAVLAGLRRSLAVEPALAFRGA
jgi:putative ABC transport system permease protein